MKKYLILALALAAAVTSGCDLVRTIAGRPTSADLETMRVELARREEAAHQARLDSMRMVQKQMADSLAALETYLLDSLSQSKGAMMNSSKFGGAGAGNTLDAKYAVVIGAFRDIGNARRRQSASYDAGYPANIVSFRNGLNAVTICPSDSINEVLEFLKKNRGTDICPKEAWILEYK